MIYSVYLSLKFQNVTFLKKEFVNIWKNIRLIILDKPARLIIRLLFGFVSDSVSRKKVKVLRRQCGLYLSRLSCCVFCICLLTNKIQMQISWVGRSTRCIYICRTIYVNLDKSASQWNPSYDSCYESGKWKIFRFRVFTIGTPEDL